MSLSSLQPQHTLSPQMEQALARISWDLPGIAVEQESFRRIEEECADVKRSMSPECWYVARRLIHTTADTGIAPLLAFRNDAIAKGVQALQNGARILSDSRMIQAGLSVPKLARCNASYSKESIVCHIADTDVVEKARQTGRTRALCAMEKARDLNELNGAIVLIGNAPLALAKLVHFIFEDKAQPALIVGMPVGFVNVCESKELLALCQTPHIVLEGRHGGSPLAVATVHALIEIALRETALKD